MHLLGFGANGVSIEDGLEPEHNKTKTRERMRLRLATRGSALARWQADWTARMLGQLGHQCELVVVTTSGDRLQGQIDAATPQGLFTREIQAAVLAGEADVAVHSLKDLPTQTPDGLVLAAVPPRATAADVMVSERFASIDALPQRAIVGTGSVRRRAQLLAYQPKLSVAQLRGNVDTRLSKLGKRDYDAIILAAAGLERLGLSGRITQRLPTEIMLPAPGQGALGIEARADDQATLAVLAALNDPETRAATTAERAMLAAIGGGCLAPVAALAEARGDRLQLVARVLSFDGTQMLQTTVEGRLAEAEELGRRAADELAARGAAELIAQTRGWLG